MQAPRNQAWANVGGSLAGMGNTHMASSRSPTPGGTAKTPPPGDPARATTPSTRRGTPSGEGTRSARPGSVPLTSSQGGSRKDMRPPLERLLDRRLQSVSTFVSSTQSADPAAPGRGMMSQWSDEMPSVIMFPTNRPCSRADAVILNRWVTSALSRYADKLSSSGDSDGNLNRVVDELVPILSIGLHEVVRQVTQHCLERGVVLEKIWRTYVELFERALSETRALLRFHKSRSARVKQEQERLTQELETVRQRHPDQIEKLSNTLLSKFSQRQEELEDQYKSLCHENDVMKTYLHEHIRNVKAWFPLFNTYKDSAFRAALQSTSPATAASTAPESRLAADFKRIITVMPEDGRRRVGFFVSSLLGLRGTADASDPDTVESLTEQRDHNAWQIERLQQRIKELRGERRGSADAVNSLQEPKGENNGPVAQ